MKTKRNWRSEDHFDIRYEDVWSLPSWFPVLSWELQLSDWIKLRRDFEFWTFNMFETDIDYGDSGSWIKCILHYAMFRYGLHRQYLNKPMKAREWNVKVCICLAQGVALFGGVALLEWVCHCGCRLWDPPPSCLEARILLAAADEDVDLSAPPTPCLPRGCHVPTLMIMDWTSEPVSQPQSNVVLIRLALVMASAHSSKTLTKTLSVTCDPTRRPMLNICPSPRTCQLLDT